VVVARNADLAPQANSKAEKPEMHAGMILRYTRSPVPPKRTRSKDSWKVPFAV
jgi:hypothetical protein